jgi:hypothetical protein
MGLGVISARISLLLAIKVSLLLVKSGLLLGKGRAKGYISESAGCRNRRLRYNSSS